MKKNITSLILVGLIIVLLGVPVYFVWRLRSRPAGV